MKFRTKCNVHVQYMAYLQSRRVTKLQQEYTWHNSMYLNRPSRLQDIVFIRQILKKTKLESVSVSCKSHRSKTANIKYLSANSTHRR